jgi:hypothetical protein
MTIQLNSRAMRTLSLWIDGRLHERKAVEWAVTLVRRTQGSLGGDATQLLRFLAEKAGADPTLSADHRTLWRLMSLAAAERTDTNKGLVGYHLKNRIKKRAFSHNDVDQLVNYVRPRLSVEPLSPWYPADDTRDSEPLRWVQWKFNAQMESLFYSAARIGSEEFGTLSPPLLRDILDRSTVALSVALQQATELGWVTASTNLPSTFVRSVVEPPKAQTSAQGEQDRDRDPDAHEEGFAPIVRLMTAAYQALVYLDATAARRSSNRWDESDGLIVRLAAFSRWFENAYSGNEVADFLAELPDAVFWPASRYPEVATLRARRWADLPDQTRITIAHRLYVGPSREALHLRPEADETYTRYLRDYEIARIVDQGQKAPQELTSTIADRRRSDPDFPGHVPATEIVSSGVTFTRGKDGDAGRFEGLAGAGLLRDLADAKENRGLNLGEDALALAASVDGRTRILRALEAAQPGDLGYENGWDTLLYSPPNRADEAVNQDDTLPSAIASLALKLADDTFAALAARLSYWIDNTEEVHRNFENSTELWVRLLPHASQAASKVSHRDVKETDLTSEALNEPLGHLISFYLRRCPNIPATGTKPTLPEPFTSSLKGLTGRAALLMANRMALTLNYFERADDQWLRSLVFAKMLDDGPDSDQLWEAFGKYGRVPSPKGWLVLADKLLSSVAASNLSPEAVKRLVEMAVIVWAWSKQGSKHKIRSSALRSALSLATDSVRAEAASQLSSFFRDRGRDQKDTWQVIGEPFFREVWPPEPMLQSGNTDKELASIPVQAGIEHFRAALTVVEPYLKPFEVWSVQSGFNLDLQGEAAQQLVRTHPEGVLSLLASSIADEQKHRVFDLSDVLDALKVANPAIDRDARFRKLRRLAYER